MNESLGIQRSAGSIHSVGIQIEFEKVARRHKFRRKGPRHEKAAGGLWVPRADMAKAVKHFFVRQDAIGGNEILE
jgi:hypothetical protein